MAELKKILLSVGDFSVPVPRKGSIETLSGFGNATAAGVEIHQRVQKSRARKFENYISELGISHEIPFQKYLFQMSGRMDGFFSAIGEDRPQIEEIKTAFNIHELKKRIEQSLMEHPYSLQLQTYGYFYWIKNKVMPKLSFHLVSTRNFKGENLEIELNIENYERWLGHRLEELVTETQVAEKNVKRRKQISSVLAFPFAEPRKGQVELIKSIEDGIQEKRKMLIQAPTGLGKTAGVLYPTLKDALSRGQKVIYITPKNSQHQVAEDTIEKFRENGAKLKALTITAKSKICMKNEPLCNPEYCEYAKDHYTKVAEHKIMGLLSKKKRLRARTFKKIAEDYQVCPFELQLDAAADVDVVICDYNYAFAPRSAFGRLASSGIDQEGKPNLVIDEAHNVPSRAMDYYSPQLSSYFLTRLRDDIGGLPSRFQQRAKELIDECIRIISACRPDTGLASRIDPPMDAFLNQEASLKEFLSEYLESDVEIQRQDLVLSLCFYWSEFSLTMEFLKGGERQEFFMTFQPHPTGGILKITCCDASEMLKSCYDDYENVVGFSATLKPFSFYSQLAGLESKSLKLSEFTSPFPKSHRKLIIVPQVSSKYSMREKNYPKIADVIHKISSLKRGNYFAFFPSFDFLDRVFEKFDIPVGFTVLTQSKSMKRNEIDFLFEELKIPESSNIVFAVQGGVLSEGVDYPGEMAIGAFVVGAPLPIFDLEREEMKKYYEQTFEAGFDYAYTFPAMAKSIQAAGRVIRSETDRGLIVLMDDRFIQPSFEKSMPSDWFKESSRELVSKSILKEVSEFWNEK